MALEQPLDGFSYILPKQNMLAWYEADSQRSNGDLFDLSLNSRHLVLPGTSAPVVQANVKNKRAGVYFDGTKNPLLYSGTVTPKHIYLVASFADPTFPDYQGLLTDSGSIAVLVGNPSTNKFFDFGFGSSFSYKKSDVTYAENNQLAPASGNLAIIEVTHTVNFPLTSIQIGLDRTFTARKWKGHFLAGVFSSEIHSDQQRREVYRYFAMKYQLWTQTSDSLNVFPFAASWRDQFEADKDVLVYKPLNASPVVRVRRGLERQAEVTFQQRYQAEIDAAEKFYDSTFPDYAFTYRDYSITPFRDYEARFISKFNRTPNNVNLGTYSFRIEAKDKV